jgi:hypothetical protein
MKHANHHEAHRLDPVLEKHLARVEAPAELWARMRAAAPGERLRPATTYPAWVAWATTAASLAVLAGGWLLWTAVWKPQPVEALAVAALRSDPRELTLHTEDATEVRAWVRAKSGIDIPLPPKHSPLVQILGARIVEAKPGRVAEVSYQVGEYRAALLVAKDPSGKTTYPNHEVRSSDPFEMARVSQWSMRGQSYTLAWAAPGEFRVACLLCHGAEPAMITPPNRMN